MWIRSSLSLAICFFAVLATAVCHDVWTKSIPLGKCSGSVRLQMCIDIPHGLQYRAYMGDSEGVSGYSGYWQSVDGAMQHAMEDYAGKNPQCLQPGANKVANATVDAPAACKDVWTKNVELGKCSGTARLQACIDIHGIQYRVYLTDSQGVSGYSGYQQSMDGAMEHAMQDYEGKNPPCLQP